MEDPELPPTGLIKTASPASESIGARMMKVEKAIASACAKSGRDYGEIRIVAVSKGRSFDDMREAYDCGLTLFGENKLQEAIEKWPVLPVQAVLHMVGHLQKNKAKKAVEIFDAIHSLDSLELAKLLNRQAEDQQKKMRVFLQINVAKEASKTGFSIEQAKMAVEHVSQMEHLDLAGLMAMAPKAKDPEMARPVFRKLRELRDRLETETGTQMRDLSMGMTQDFPVAVEEGATYLRLGKAIFG